MIIERPANGKYLGVEGVGGVGKTYYARMLADRADVTLVSEVPESGLGRNIFRALADTDDEFFRHGYPTVEALAFYGMKLYSVQNTVVSSLEAGETVIQDRPFYSTSIYAAILEAERGERSVMEYFEEFDSIRSTLSFAPDVNVYLYDSFDACLDRIQKREGRTFNHDEIRIMREMYTFYDELMERYPDEFYKLDIRDRTDREVIEEMLEIVELIGE